MSSNHTDSDIADEDFHPTARAIVEQFKMLQKKSGVKGGTAKRSFSTPKSTAKTTPVSGRTMQFKTPTGSAKRARASAMSDDDGDDDETKMDFDTPLAKRTTPSRRSGARKIYADPDSSEGDAIADANGGNDSDDGLDAAFEAVKASVKVEEVVPSVTKEAGSHDPSERPDSVTGRIPAIASKGKAGETRGHLEEDSDGSDFLPF